MHLSMKKVIFLLIVVFTVSKGYSQVYVPAYGNVVNQCLQTNITNNLTEYEALGLKRRGR